MASKFSFSVGSAAAKYEVNSALEITPSQSWSSLAAIRSFISSVHSPPTARTPFTATGLPPLNAVSDDVESRPSASAVAASGRPATRNPTTAEPAVTEMTDTDAASAPSDAATS